MKDQILAGFVRDFRERFDLEHDSDSVVFEYFANHCVLTRYHCDSFDLDQIRVGGGGDGALDGVSIILNDHVVTTIEEVEYFLKNHRTLDVDFVFVQAKTSPKFETKEMGSFFFGVEQFLSAEPELPFNDDVKSLWNVKNFIYENCTLRACLLIHDFAGARRFSIR